MIKPLLAGTLEDMDMVEKYVRFPVMGSYKLDGFRAMVQDGKLMSRNGLPIRNKHCQKLYKNEWLKDLDGELICGKPTDANLFNTTSSAVTSAAGEPKVTYCVFDWFGELDTTYDIRMTIVRRRVKLAGIPPSVLKFLAQKMLHNIEELVAFEEAAVLAGYEGVMLRDPMGVYKQGRSTVREGILLKIKRFEDAEAVVMGTYEAEHNGNTEKTASGKRSSKKAGKVKTGTLGGFVCVNIKCKCANCSRRLSALVNCENKFQLGRGTLTHVQAQQLWQRRATLVGEIVKYKFQPVGVVDKPRLPIFLGFRNKGDM